jgi:hypothetical protein
LLSVKNNVLFKKIILSRDLHRPFYGSSAWK